MASNAQEKPTIKQNLAQLNCPFTWELLDSVIKHRSIRDYDQKPDNINISYPLEILINSLFHCYMAVISADNDAAAETINKAEEVLIQIQQEQEFHKTIKAIEHVFYATKCFFLYEIEKMDELEEILVNIIIDIDHFTDVELGALYGCQSVIWSNLSDFGMNKAVDIAKKAVEKDENCALWHFVLAKNLRRQRRMISLSSNISNMEEKHFEIAYAMSKSHIFGIYYLQMRLEKFYAFSKDPKYKREKMLNEKQVVSIAKNILKSNPTEYTVLLKLARIFLRSNYSDEIHLTKECLDSVQKITPNNPTYLHYYGMLYEDNGEYREALKYFKKAAEYNNFIAEISYIQYGWEIGELEPLPHLLRMLKKYKQSINERQIVMLLNIAIAYHSLHKDVRNAAAYFLKALAIDPQNKKFTVYYKFLDFATSSISFFLIKEFCPILEPLSAQMCQEIKTLLNVKDTSDLSTKFNSLSMKSEKNDSPNN